MWDYGFRVNEKQEFLHEWGAYRAWKKKIIDLADRRKDEANNCGQKN